MIQLTVKFAEAAIEALKQLAVVQLELHKTKQELATTKEDLESWIGTSCDNMLARDEYSECLKSLVAAVEGGDIIDQQRIVDEYHNGPDKVTEEEFTGGGADSSWDDTPSSVPDGEDERDGPSGAAAGINGTMVPDEEPF